MRENVCGDREVSGRCVKTIKCLLTSITPNRTREMRVNRAGKAIVSKRVSGDAPGAEILGGKHAPRRHDTNQGVECRCRWILELW